MDNKTLGYFKLGFNIEIPVFMVGVLVAAYNKSIFWIIFFLSIVIVDIIALKFIEKKLK